MGFRKREADDRPGWLDAAATVLKKLLRSSRFKVDVRSILKQIDPASAPELVRVALLTDPSLSLSLMDALPRAANALIEGVRELAEQTGRMPVALMANFLAETLGQIQLAKLGEASGRLTAMSLKLTVQDPDWPGFVREYTRGFASVLGPDELTESLRAAAARVVEVVEQHPEWIQATAHAIEKTLAEQPVLIDKLLVPLLGPILQAIDKGSH